MCQQATPELTRLVLAAALVIVIAIGALVLIAATFEVIGS